MAVDIITEQPEFRIRASRPADVESITELVNLPGFRFGTLRMPYQTLEQTRKWMESPSVGGLQLVAELDGRIVGQAGLHRLAGRRSHAAGIGLGVHDDYCGKGIGSALVKELVDAADNWLDIRRLELAVFSDNAAAIAVYRKFGFEVEGTYRAHSFRDGRYVDSLAMARLRGL